MDEDASKLTDEELDQRIAEGEPTATPEPVETPSEPAAEVESEEASPEEPSEEQPEEPAQEVDKKEVPEEQPPSRREQLRIQQLLAKYGPPPERQTSQQPSQFKREDALDYQTALDADPEVIKQLEDDRQREGQAQYNRGLQDLQYTQFYNNIRFDLPLVSEKLSKLDPMDAKSIDDEYLAITGADPNKGYVRNPDIGYAEFVEARLEQAERLAHSMNAQTVKNVAKQSAQTGLRPDGSSAKRLNLNQAPENMSDEELDAVIAQAIPKK